MTSIIGQYELRLFDEPVLLIELGESSDGTWYAHALDRGIAPLPLGMEADDGGIEKWLATRALPYNRTYADKLCMQMGIAPSDTARIVEVSHGLSLNDSYWLVPKGFDGAYADYNLYENSFSDLLAVVAYTGKLDTSMLGSHGLTPELTSGGSLPKAWRIGATGERLLYKGKTAGSNPGEPTSEVAASALETIAGLRSTAYWLDTWQDRECSVCRCFCSADVSYVPFAVATHKTALPDVLAYAMRMDEESFEECTDMFVFDSIVGNVDRHLTNFGFLVDAPSQKVLCFAPIFDNGRALFPNVSDEDIADAAVTLNYMRPAFGALSFDGLAEKLVGDRQKEWIASLHDSDIEAAFNEAGLTARRSKHLAAFVKNRCETILQMKSIDREAFREAIMTNFPDAKRFVEEHAMPEAGSAAEKDSNIAGAER